jgi:hypothetical protein
MFSKIKNFIASPEIVVILLSLCFTLIVSGIIGMGGNILFNNFWGTFFIAFGCQFVLFFVLNTILQKKDEETEAKITTDQLNALSKYVIKLTCAYCSNSNSVPIVLNNENKYKCESCQQVNGVKMQFFSTQITVPLEKVVLPEIIQVS